GALQHDFHRFLVLFRNNGDIFLWFSKIIRFRARLDNASLFASNLGQYLAQVIRVVEANRHDHGDICVDHIGGIPRTAHAYFHHGYVDGSIGKSRVGNTHDDFELAHRRSALSFGSLVHHLDIRLDFFPDPHVITWVYRLAINSDAFGHALQMRAGHQPHAAVEAPQQRINHARSRRFSIGTRNLDDIKGSLWIAQQVHEHFDATQRWFQLSFRPAQIQLCFHRG